MRKFRLIDAQRSTQKEKRKESHIRHQAWSEYSLTAIITRAPFLITVPTQNSSAQIGMSTAKPAPTNPTSPPQQASRLIQPLPATAPSKPASSPPNSWPLTRLS